MHVGGRGHPAHRRGTCRAEATLEELETALNQTGVGDGDRSYNLGWHDWLNLRNLLSISRVITRAALARENSRGAHFREDFPDTGSLEESSYTLSRLVDGQLLLSQEPVLFTRVRPGESLLDGWKPARGIISGPAANRCFDDPRSVRAAPTIISPAAAFTAHLRTGFRRSAHSARLAVTMVESPPLPPMAIVRAPSPGPGGRRPQACRFNPARPRIRT